jgi:Arc/MetJ-type ribon-helix-helix transcriptional regulator
MFAYSLREGTTKCVTLEGMATITIRTDPAVDEALAALTEERQSRSDAIRAAILLAYREQRHARLRAEAEALRDDPGDVAATRQLATEMDSVRAW